MHIEFKNKLKKIFFKYNLVGIFQITRYLKIIILLKRNLKYLLKRDDILYCNRLDLKFKNKFFQISEIGDIYYLFLNKLKYEEEEEIILLNKKFNFDNKTIIDIGANFGIFSLLVNKYQKEVNFISIDGLDINLAKENYQLNNLKNIKSYKIFLSDRILNKKYYKPKGMFANLYPPNSGNTSLEEKIDISNFYSQIIKTDTIDNFLEKNQNKSEIGLIKIDVEGHEYNVLKGGEKIIKKFKPIIYIEIDFPFLNEKNLKIKFLELIGKLNYTINILHNSKIIKISDFKKIPQRNYLLIPNE